jgi:methylglutaconyl-CoA hydratase
MYRAIDECPCPVVGRIHGSAFGGGVGLVAVCDIVVAAEDTTFALSEVKLGLVPAVISPFLLRKTGESFLRRYCLTGETFSAPVAKQFNLVHDLVETDTIGVRTNDLVSAILRLAPQAARHTKALLRQILPLPDADRWKVCAKANADARLSGEATEGLRAFLEKRPPAWVSKQGQRQTQVTSNKSPDVAGHRA